MTLELTPSIMATYGIAKTFTTESTVNSLDFHSDGEAIVTATDDGVLTLYNASSAEIDKTVHSKVIGCSNAIFTHHEHAILYTGDKHTKSGDYGMKYLSFHDNVVIHNFQGHKNLIKKIAMSPVNDNILSVSADSFRLWDLRQMKCTGVAKLGEGGAATISYDHSGFIFALAYNNQIKLYDARNYAVGPFQTSLSSLEDGVTHIEFSPNDDFILTQGPNNSYDVIHSSKYNTVSSVRNIDSETSIRLPVTFSADSKYIIGGLNKEGDIAVWSAETGTQISLWKGHTQQVTALKWSPKTELAITCGSTVAFWLPGTAAV